MIYSIAIMKLLVGLLIAFQSLLVTASTTDSAPLTTPSVVPKPTNFTYPWPVQYFDLNSQQQRLSMAYMDVSPKKPNGRAAVLLHGKNFCGATWEVTARALLDAGYRVVLPDQIGFCKSSKPTKYQFSFQLLASSTKNLLSHVGLGNKTVAVIGHSMGGMLATRYALMHPGQTAPLVLINPLGLEDWKAIGVPWRSIDDLYNDELRQNFTTIKAYQQSTYYVNTWKPEYDIWVKMLDDIYHGPERYEFSYDSALVTDMVLSQPVVYEFPLLKMKTLLLIGEKDNTAIGKAWAPESIKPLLGRYDLLGNQTVAKIPKGSLIPFSDLGHAPQIQDPSRFHSALLRWLSTNS